MKFSGMEFIYIYYVHTTHVVNVDVYTIRESKVLMYVSTADVVHIFNIGSNSLSGQPVNNLLTIKIKKNIITEYFPARKHVFEKKF